MAGERSPQGKSSSNFHVRPVENLSSFLEPDKPLPDESLLPLGSPDAAEDRRGLVLIEFSDIRMASLVLA